MLDAVRPYATVGVALVGATVIAATPIQPPHNQTRSSDALYSLVAATTTTGEACTGYYTDGCDISAEQTYTPVELDLEGGSIWNIPANIVNALISIPRAYVDAVNDLSYSLEVTGSWWVYTPTNVLGYDPADPAKIAAVLNLLIPFEALSNPLGELVAWLAKANLPMNAGCTGTASPACEDVGAILSGMFQVSIWDLFTGYTFPEVINPVSDAEGAAGEPIDGEEGEEVAWSGATVQINPLDSVYSVINYLLADPEENAPEAVTLTELVETVSRLGAALWEDFYPFVPGSWLWKGYPYTLVTDLITPFVSILCPDCDPEHPEDPTPFDGELPPSSEDGEAEAGSTSLLAAGVQAVDAVAPATSEPAAAAVDVADVETFAVQGLLAKFATPSEGDAGEQPDSPDIDPVTAADGPEVDTDVPAESEPLDEEDAAESEPTEADAGEMSTTDDDEDSSATDSDTTSAAPNSDKSDDSTASAGQSHGGSESGGDTGE